MLYVLNVKLRVVFQAFRTFLELREKMDQNVLLDLDSGQPLALEVFLFWFTDGSFSIRLIALMFCSTPRRISRSQSDLISMYGVTSSDFRSDFD